MTPYDIALQELGVKEIHGPDDHPRIVEYHEYTDLVAQDDETAWCAALVNFCLAESVAAANGRSWRELEMPGTGKANARSLLEFSEPVMPQRGSIVVLWRKDPDSWQGHVGFCCEPDDGMNHVLVLGGNQSNAVTIKPYPHDRVLGFRRTI